MQDYVLIIGSVTSAIRAKRSLANEGIKVSITKQTDKKDSGCRYGIHVKNADLMRVVLVLREQEIPYTMNS
jgi:ribulose 1,5-bisphosphate synthetase/thiazole synthase